MYVWVIKDCAELEFCTVLYNSQILLRQNWGEVWAILPVWVNRKNYKSVMYNLLTFKLEEKAVMLIVFERKWHLASPEANNVLIAKVNLAF